MQGHCTEGFRHIDIMMQSDTHVSPVRRTDLRLSSGTGLASSPMSTPMAAPPPIGEVEFLLPNSKHSDFGVDSMQVQSPDTCELSSEWQALPCEMVSSTPVVAHQTRHGASREGFHCDSTQELNDTSISLDLDPQQHTTVSPFAVLCKNELRELQQSVFNSSSLTNPDTGTGGRGPLPSWSAFSSSKDIVGDSRSSGAGNTVGDSSTAYARTLTLQWQAVPEHSQLPETSMVHQLLADRHLGAFDSVYDWTVQPGNISADSTAMATDDAGTSLRASEAGMESQTGTHVDSASGEQDRPGSAQGTFMSSDVPSSLTQEGLLEHLREEGTPPRATAAETQALCVDNPLAHMDSSTLTSARSSLPDPRKERGNGSQDGDDGFRTHCNPLCNHDSPRSTVPSNPPSGRRSGERKSPIVPSTQFAHSPTSRPRRTASSAVNAETQTSQAKSNPRGLVVPPALAPQQELSTPTEQPAGNSVGTGTGPRDRPRTTSCHVLYSSASSLAPLSECCATVYQSCLEPASLQSSADLSGSSGSLLLTDSHQFSQIQDGVQLSGMTQDGTTCLLSGMLSKIDSCQTKPTSLSGGLLPSASIGSSAQLSISLPARPQIWEEGLSDTLALEKHGSVSTASEAPAIMVQNLTHPDVNDRRHVFVSPRSKVAGTCVPEVSNSVEPNPMVPKLNLCLAGLSQLVPDELPHGSNSIKDDLLGAQLQPEAMAFSTMENCTDKAPDVSEQFACGPIASTYIDSLYDMHPLAAPNTDRSVSGSVNDSFQTLATDGKGSSGGVHGAAGDSGVHACPSSMHSHSTASSCSAPSFKYYSSSTRDDVSAASQFTRKDSSVCADDSATSPTFRVHSNGADHPKPFSSFAINSQQSSLAHQTTGADVTPESSLSRRRPLPLHVMAEPSLAFPQVTAKDVVATSMQQFKAGLNAQLETVDELTPSPLHPSLAERFGAFGGACHSCTSGWAHEPSPDITWTPFRDRPTSWAPVLNYNSPAALEPFGRANTALLPTPSPIAAWNRASQEGALRNNAELPSTPTSVSKAKPCSDSAAAGTPSGNPLSKSRVERPWRWLCLKSPWASPDTDANGTAVAGDSAEESADYSTCMSPPVAMDSVSPLEETSSTLPLLPADCYSHSLPLFAGSSSILGPVSSSIQLVSQGPTDCSNSMETGSTNSLSDALLPLPPSESEASDQTPATPSKSKKRLSNWRNQEFTTATSSLKLSQSALPPCGRIFRTSNTCAESRTPARGASGAQRGILLGKPAEGGGGSATGTPVKAVRAFLVPKRRIMHGRPGPVEASHDEDVNLLDGIVGIGALEEDALIARCTTKSAALGSPAGCLRQEKPGLLEQVSTALHCLCCMRRELRVLE